MNQVVQFQPEVEAKRARKTGWQRANRAAFAAEHGYSTTANYGAGGNRDAVLERDGHACVQCGMTDAEHKAKWDRPITVDHISKDRSDNSLGNLQTLCLTCHGRKDLIPRLRTRKAEPLHEDMRTLRAKGLTYQAIADQLGLSIGTVWKYLKRDQP